MKSISLASAFAITLGMSTQLLAQTASPNSANKQSVNGVVSQQSGTAKPTTSGVTGLQRKGSGKMAAGISRNGNTNLSPTGATNTQGSTSEGMGSAPSPGGAKGTNTQETKRTAGAGQAKSTKNGTASDGGLTSSGTPTYGAKVNTPTTARSTGSSESSAQRNAGSQGSSKVSTESTSGSTGGSKRPTSAAQVEKEARTPDKNVSTGYPRPTGPGKSGTPSGNAKGKQAGGNSYPQQ